MLRILAILVVGLCATGARAADKLEFGPPPAWVKPEAAVKPGPLPTSGPAVRFLRYDEQLRFEANGRSAYTHYVTQVRSSLGLGGLGTVALRWDPAHGTATVHTLRIVRDGQPIDILAKQTFTTIRREENLEQIVDGELTATLQPEDLRVGDVLEVAYTITHDEPAMKGHADFAFDLTAMRGIDSLSVRAVWPDTMPVAWKTGSALQAPAITHHGGETELLIETKDLPELKIAYDAPRRFWPRRDVEMSSFKTWGEVAATVAPAFEKAAQLAPDSPLKAEAAKIAAASKDPKVRAAMALKLVQEQVRYLGLLLSDGGYTPVDADKTWARRFGECKAKATLLTALLRELGIKAEPALVNAFGDPIMDQRLPRMTAFNHVIVRAEIDGKVYWLDGTRPGDTTLDALEVPRHDFALPIRADGAELIALVRAPRGKPDREVALEIDATSGIEAAGPVKGEMIVRGDAAMFSGLFAANLAADQRDRLLKMMWAGYPVEVKTVTSVRDDKTGETRLTMTGTAKLGWYPAPASGPVFFPPGASLGYRADFKREDGLPKDAPYLVRGYPSASLFRLTLKLPVKGVGFKLTAPDVDKAAAGQAFFRKTRLENGVLTMEVSTRALAPEFPASEAKAASEALSELASQRVYLTAPDDYRGTAGDIAAWQAQEPKSAQDFINRGANYSRVGRIMDARADFDKAIALDARASWAYSGRGIVRLRLDDLVGAGQDYEKAVSLEDRNAQGHVGVGLVAMREGRYEDAIAAFTRATYLQGGVASALMDRARAYLSIRQYDRALADTDELLRLRPKLYSTRYLRMEINVARKDYDHALAEMDLAIAENPTNPAAVTMRASVLQRMGRTDDADKGYAAALAMQPSPEPYVTRASLRPKTDVAGKLADLAAAEKAAPYANALKFMRARVLSDAGRHAEAIQVLNRLAEFQPGYEGLAQLRGWNYAKSGQTALAAKDFTAVRAKAAGKPVALNALCWTEATLGMSLDLALADCSAALSVLPKYAAALDSEGFVYLRLGRLKDAVDAYDAAIEQRPGQAESLYGRGLAKLRLGKASEGEADIAAAQKASDGVEDEFKGYGVTR
jgi:tetratricopeptide (TPR) repeat protein